MKAGTLYALLAALGFAAVSTFTQIALDHGATLWNVLMWRFVIAGTLLGAFVASRRYAPVPPAEVARLIAIGGAGQALLIGLALSSLQFINVATLAFLFYTYPAWVALVQTVRGAERLTSRSGLALAASFAGTAIIAGAPALAGGPARTGAALALAAAAVYGVYIPVMQWMQKDHPVPLTSFYAKFGSAVCFLALAAWNGSVTMSLSREAWWATAGLAVLSTLVPGVLFLMALMHIGPVRTAIVSTVEPLLTAVLGLVVLHQATSANLWVGGGLILGAVLLLEGVPTRPKSVEN